MSISASVIRTLGLVAAGAAFLVAAILVVRQTLEKKQKLASQTSPAFFLRADVFISYAWGPEHDGRRVYQEKAFALAVLLKSKGYTVWNDTEQMKYSGGSGVEQAMLEGIRNARLVLVCASPWYLESKNCKIEAECASSEKDVESLIFVNIGKADDRKWNPKASGNPTWLSELMKDELFFNVSWEREGTLGLDIEKDLVDALDWRLRQNVSDVKQDIASASIENLRQLNQGASAISQPPASGFFDPVRNFSIAQKSNTIHLADEMCACKNYKPMKEVGKWHVFEANPGEQRKDIDALWTQIKAFAMANDFPSTCPILCAKICRKQRDNRCILVYSVEGEPKNAARQWLISKCGVPEAELLEKGEDRVGRWKPEKLTEEALYSTKDVLRRGGGETPQ